MKVYGKVRLSCVLGAFDLRFRSREDAECVERRKLFLCVSSCPSDEAF